VRSAAKVSLNLGSVHFRRDAYLDAATHYRKAAVLFARIGDMEHSIMADIGLADALSMTGEFDEAMRMFERARMRAERRAFPVLAAKVEQSIALLQFARGRYREALAGLESSRRRYEMLSLPHDQAIEEKLLADAYLELRLLPEAQSLFEQALARFVALAMPREQALAYAQLGRVFALMARPMHANEALTRAAELFVAQGNRVGVASIDLARAELALAARRDAEALAFAQQAADEYARAALAEGGARAEVVRAQALLALSRIDEARAAFDASLRQARQQQLSPVELRCLIGQGLVAQAANDSEAARVAFEAAIDLFEDQRRVLPGDELRSAFLSDHLRPFRELLRMALAAHAQAPTAEHAGQVLRQQERFRARTLGDRLVHVRDETGDPDLQSLRSRLNLLYRRLRRAQQDAEPTAGLIDEVRHAERELLERARRHRLLTPAPSNGDAVGDDLSALRLYAALPDDAALVEYGVIDDELFACIVTSGGVEVRRRIARWSDTLRANESARFQIETLRFGAAQVAHHIDELTLRTRKRMEQLHAMLWAPLRDALAPYRRVAIVPHAQLAMLPFGALHDGRSFLAESLALAIVPSARYLLHGLRRAFAAPERALVLGESATLPHAEREARFVASLFADHALYVNEDATIAALSADCPRADVIHLACHAQFRGDSPMFSALQLHDGALTAESIEALKLRAGIVVLSACETGLADAGSGDEMFGLVRSFLVAGAARVVASLWPVDDEATSAFMSHFYAALAGGAASAEALRLSQRAVMHARPHPYYWAGFTLFGGW
jgi:CHAT domain-containing protein